MSTPALVSTSRREALEQFIDTLHRDYYPWYEQSVKRHYAVWLPLQILTLMSGVATSIIAALLSNEAFEGFGFGRILLVVLPALGAAASSVAVQARLYDRYQLRERGRVAFQDLFHEGQRRYAAAATDEEYTQIHQDLQDKVRAIEVAQGEGFFSFLKPGATP